MPDYGTRTYEVSEKADKPAEKKTPEKKPAAKAPAKKKTPAKKRAPRKKAQAKKAQPKQILEHDADKHKGNTTSSRPDLEPQKADKALEEVRRIRQENEDRLATHNRVTVDEVVDCVKGTLTVRAADRLVYVDAKNAVLDQDGAINLRHAVEAAFQAVS